MSALTVVKVGGSLCADEARLSRLLAALADGIHGACVIVPGGGTFADAVRAAQAREGFDDATAHRRALDAMGRMAEMFRVIEPRLVTVQSSARALPSPLSGGGWADGSPWRERGSGEGSDRAGCGVPLSPPAAQGTLPRRGGRESVGDGLEHETLVWDPALLRSGHPDIPETWDVTSDSLALWLARETGAARCVLVKSAAVPPGRSPADLARLGLVDAAFPTFAARFAGRIELWGPDGAVTLADRIAA